MLKKCAFYAMHTLVTMKKTSETRSTPEPKKKAKPAPKEAKPKAVAKKTKTPSSTKKAKPAPKKKPSPPARQDADIIVIDDDIQYDPQREAEERRAYLEEARSQETLD